MRSVNAVELDVFDREGKKLPFVMTFYGIPAASFFTDDDVMILVGETMRRRGWRDKGYHVRQFAVRERRVMR